MNERDFLYWLQGFLELSGQESLSKEQVQVIREHISLVLSKQTPHTIVNVRTPVSC